MQHCSFAVSHRIVISRSCILRVVACIVNGALLTRLSKTSSNPLLNDNRSAR